MVLAASFPKPDLTASIGAMQMEAAISSLPGCVAPTPTVSTKLAKLLQTEGLEEQSEELMRRHGHKTENQKAPVIPWGEPHTGFP